MSEQKTVYTLDKIYPYYPETAPGVKVLIQRITRSEKKALRRHMSELQDGFQGASSESEVKASFMSGKIQMSLLDNVEDQQVEVFRNHVKKISNYHTKQGGDLENEEPQLLESSEAIDFVIENDEKLFNEIIQEISGGLKEKDKKK